MPVGESVVIDTANACELDSWFGWVLQTVLGIIAFLTLIYKRHREFPRRPALVWLFDTSKQMGGVLLQHFSNILFALLMSQFGETDTCVWYLCTHMLDSVVGVSACCFLNVCVNYVVDKNPIVLSRCRSGYYGDIHDPSILSFFIQFSIWVLIVAMSKLVVFPMLVFFAIPLYNVFAIMLLPLTPSPRLESATVLIILPLVINTTIFWIQDSFLKDTERSRMTGVGIGTIPGVVEEGEGQRMKTREEQQKDAEEEEAKRKREREAFFVIGVDVNERIRKKANERKEKEIQEMDGILEEDEEEEEENQQPQSQLLQKKKEKRKERDGGDTESESLLSYVSSASSSSSSSSSSASSSSTSASFPFPLPLDSGSYKPTKTKHRKKVKAVSASVKDELK